jgi:hypothetical protein
LDQEEAAAAGAKSDARRKFNESQAKMRAQAIANGCWLRLRCQATFDRVIIFMCIAHFMGLRFFALFLVFAGGCCYLARRAGTGVRISLSPPL